MLLDMRFAACCRRSQDVVTPGRTWTRIAKRRFGRPKPIRRCRFCKICFLLVQACLQLCIRGASNQLPDAMAFLEDECSRLRAGFPCSRLMLPSLRAHDAIPPAAGGNVILWCVSSLRRVASGNVRAASMASPQTPTVGAFAAGMTARRTQAR